MAPHLPKCNSTVGFSLIEILVAAAIMGITILATLIMIFGSRNSAILRSERDKIVRDLEYSRLQSKAAYKGQGFSIEFATPETYTIQPEHTTRIIKNDTHIISPALPLTITFSKITGRPDQALTLILQKNNLQVTISVSNEGIVETTQPEKP